MVDIDILKREFWKGEYKTKIYKFSDEGVKASIMRALGDFTDRTTRLKPEYQGQSFGVDRKFRVLCGTDGHEHNFPEVDSFVDEFIRYFKSNDIFKDTQSFDDWHHEMCSKFLSVFNNIYDDLAYGKAQKVVNMTFKNVYCLEDENQQNHKERYTFCHMPLDSFTLEWVKRTQAWLCSKSAESSGCKRKKAETLCSTKIPSWSNMENIDIVDDKKKIVQYGYITIQEKIREYLKEFAGKNPATKYLIKACNAEIKKKNLTPLQAEFFVWKYMQLELAAEGVYNQFLSFESMDSKEEKDKKEEYRNETINKKLADLQDKLKDIEKYKVQE